jgi:hypothetical protein
MIAKYMLVSKKRLTFHFPYPVAQIGSRDSVVGIATGLRFGRSAVRVAADTADFSLLRNVQTLLRGPLSLLFSGYRDPFLGIKRLEHGVDHSALPSAEVKNEWSNASTALIHLHVMDRENVTLFIIRVNLQISNKVCFLVGAVLWLTTFLSVRVGTLRRSKDTSYENDVHLGEVRTAWWLCTFL